VRLVTSHEYPLEIHLPEVSFFVMVIFSGKLKETAKKADIFKIKSKDKIKRKCYV